MPYFFEINVLCINFLKSVLTLLTVWSKYLDYFNLISTQRKQIFKSLEFCVWELFKPNVISKYI